MNDRLSDRVADDILTMITIEKRFLPGEKLPNENKMSEELGISRTTLREAIRILAANGVVEILRGRGTYVRNDLVLDKKCGLSTLGGIKTDIRDLYEMRLIVEPEAAFLAAQRAGEEEIRHIALLGKEIERAVSENRDRTEVERGFHKAIAKATHNEFMNKLMPVIYQAIDQGVRLSVQNQKVVSDTLQDHRLITEFLLAGNSEGARYAMKIHLLHAMQELEIK
ncbi:FadR family transcriptional regulator [Ruminococcus sp. OA3]|uniref:FadR/GntR family transcriptional regulator n=1 Tax=Ruminococcus sp. OA3 TaxID=2914164 RepID=UPI001F06F42D|nr:FadR/GntR family transcriptional regulator [Ruminococcus sp. OA3]MCH1984356.1 FadR family transcriptional regulator [Ruminococcus sp. OA3]